MASLRRKGKEKRIRVGPGEKKKKGEEEEIVVVLVLMVDDRNPEKLE